MEFYGVLSLANALNKRGSYLVISYLVIDQTAAACRGLGSNSESNHSQNSIKLPLAPHQFSSVLSSFSFLSLGVMVTSLKKKFAALPSP